MSITGVYAIIKRMNDSVIYQNIRLYRLVMTVLYRGCYTERFDAVLGLLRETDRSVLELCFGDVMIAEACRKRGIAWRGLDACTAFVDHAVSRGFDAQMADLLGREALPPCDLCVMMGSLYHFNICLDTLFVRIKESSKRFVISEPIRNWTTGGRFLKWCAIGLTHVGGRTQTFRFNEASLIKALDQLSVKIGFTYRVVSVSRDMVVEVSWLK